MAYRVVIVKPAEREQLIRASLREPHCEQQDFYDFRNRKTRLNVVPLDLQLPIYRMENLRAFIHQRDYILAAQKPEDYFRLNEEDEGVQQIQHEILVKLAHKGRDASVVPIIEVLGKEKQREGPENGRRLREHRRPPDGRPVADGDQDLLEHGFILNSNHEYVQSSPHCKTRRQAAAGIQAGMDGPA